MVDCCLVCYVALRVPDELSLTMNFVSASMATHPTHSHVCVELPFEKPEAEAAKGEGGIISCCSPALCCCHFFMRNSSSQNLINRRKRAGVWTVWILEQNTPDRITSWQNQHLEEFLKRMLVRGGFCGAALERLFSFLGGSEDDTMGASFRLDDNESIELDRSEVEQSLKNIFCDPN